MASKVESVVGAASEGGRAVVADDPHANYRIGSHKYLAIMENGEYIVSFKPQKIPEGVVVEADPVDTCRKGVRRFRVRRYGFDTFDLVTVGTITIQNGFAYIAGQYIDGEVPDRSNEFVFIPPFVIPYSLKPPDDRDQNKFAKEMEDKVHKHLKEQVAKYCLCAPENVLDIDLNRRYSLHQQNLCWRCGNKIYIGGVDICEVCFEELLAKESHVSSSTNDGGGGGDKVETHKASIYKDGGDKVETHQASMDKDVEDDHDHGSGKKRQRLDLVN